MNENGFMPHAEDLEGISDPFGRYERIVKEGKEHFDELAGFVRMKIVELQTRELLPSEPMREQDRINLVETLIQALDRGLCFDDDLSKTVWIERSARAIYEAQEKK